MFRVTFPAAAGVSAMSLYMPPARVHLKNWCQWTHNSWDKIQSVVGNSFRIPTHNENAYTMAATAVYRLIVQNNIDPSTIGFLGFGTESSSDNSAGAIIIKGMVEGALLKQHPELPDFNRYCEVPEYKHACLGGIYALKNACRYVDTDGVNIGNKKPLCGIVVASDVAEYARGSTGEQTQGAGAVAMLVEHKPKMFEVNLKDAGSSSAYRGFDFRKPFKRHFMTDYHLENPMNGHNNINGKTSNDIIKIPDFPVFSGPYSTVAYLDEVKAAVERMLANIGRNYEAEHKGEKFHEGDYYHNQVSHIFFHRPYKMMPIQAMSFLYTRALAHAESERHRSLFADLCAKAKVDPDAVRTEVSTSSSDLYRSIVASVDTTMVDSVNSMDKVEIDKLTNAVAKILRKDASFIELLEKKMSLGTELVANFGNLYTGSLPAWVAAGFYEAAEKKLAQGAAYVDGITNKHMVMIGYGSGDAAEAIPITAVPGWEKHANKINIKEIIDESRVMDLTQEQYEGLHSGAVMEDICAQKHKPGCFVIDRVGKINEVAFQDIGIEYYNFVQ